MDNVRSVPVDEIETLCETASPNVTSGNTPYFFTKPTFQFRHILVALHEVNTLNFKINL